MRRRSRKPGQALVEFALASIVIFLILSASIDLGLMFLTQQTVVNATEEGAAFGSRNPLFDTSVSPPVFRVDAREIRNRVRTEGGLRQRGSQQVSGTGTINLQDLNADGINDASQPAVLNDRIRVSLVVSNSISAAPCASSTPVQNCYLVVDVRATYKPFMFFFAAFRSEVTVRGYTVRLMQTNNVRPPITP